MPTRSRPRRGVRAVAKDRWDQALDRLADQLFGGPAEHRLDRTIRKDEPPARVRRHDALRGGLEQRSQRAIVFLVATRLERILNPAALGDVQFESSEPRDSAGRRRDRLVPDSASMRTAPSGPHDPVRVIPRILVVDAEPRRVCDARRGRSSACTRASHVSNSGGSSGVNPNCARKASIPVGVIRRGDPMSRSRRPTLRARGGAAFLFP